MGKIQCRQVQMASLSPLMEEVLAQGSSVELTVTGNSMYPMLRHRVSRVRLSPAAALKKYDIPLYRRDNGAYVLHRIIAQPGSTLTCCGDNQWQPEPGIRPDQVIAVVTAFARNGRWVPCRNVCYRIYCCVWVAVRPLRGAWKRLRPVLGRIRRKLF